MLERLINIHEAIGDRTENGLVRVQDSGSCGDFAGDRAGKTVAAQWQGEIDRFTAPEAAAEAAAEAVAAAEGAVEEGKKAGAAGGASKRAKRAKRAKRTKKVGDDEGASAAATGGASAGANDATGGGLSRAVRVIHYTGPPSPYSEAKALDLVADLRSAELVLTDLATIRKEYHYLQVGR